MSFEQVRNLNGLKGIEYSRQKSINEYYKSPNYCKECGNVIMIRLGERACLVKKKKFCNHSCAAKLNNRNTRRGPKARNLCVCGKKLNRKSKMCFECRDNAYMDRPIELLKRKQYPHWTRVRAHAKKQMVKFGVERKCIKCMTNEFESVLEVCHRRDITKFPLTALIREVNHINNLVYLCPSHHALFDRGLIEI